MAGRVQAGASLHIGDVADRVGLSLRTVRYYEEQGLIRPAGRTQGGFRLYTEEQVDRLLLIKQMKPLGFTVAQMCELLEARDVLLADGASAEARTEARERLAAWSRAADEKVDELRGTLRRAEELCRALAETAAATRDR